MSSFLHLRGLKIRWRTFLVNKVYTKQTDRHFKKKRKLLRLLGHNIGEGTKIVSPIFCSGKLNVGKNCWIGKNFAVNGNGVVTIGDNCDIAPDVVFSTGSHAIGDKERRAGEGVNNDFYVGNGVWIGTRATFINKVHVGDSSVVAACACVTKDVPSNVVVGGVPAKVIRVLEE